jgi:hypothetical protein
VLGVIAKLPLDRLEVFEPWTEPTEAREPMVAVEPEPAPAETSPSEPVAAAGPAAFLREHAMPQIAEAGRRVHMADHQLMMQDLLDLPEPALRVLFWARPGPMAATPERTRVTLEFAVDREEPDEVVAHWWSKDVPSKRHSLGRVPVDALDLDWVRSRLLDAIEAALKQV